MTVAEVISKVAREGQNIEIIYDVLLNNSQVVNFDEEVSKEAGMLHAQIRKTEKALGLPMRVSLLLRENSNQRF